MFLKSYLDLSDKDLIERINTDCSLQCFCHFYITTHVPIRDTNLPSDIRVELSMLHVDGVNFVEHLSFKAFHEGNRLQNGINLQHKLFGKCSTIATAAIYAKNNKR